MTSEIQIAELVFPENVRSRYGMYIGGTNNCSTLLRELVDNAVDEAYHTKSPCDKIWISDTGVYHVVADNGRGIPISPSTIHPRKTMALQSVTSLHAGSKFNKTEIQSGMNGVGSSVCNALSEEYFLAAKLTEKKLKNTTKKVLSLSKGLNISTGEFYYLLKLKEGRLVKEAVIERSGLESLLGTSIDARAMTVAAFKPDLTIFSSRVAALPSTLKFTKYITAHYNKQVRVFHNGVEYTEQFTPYNIEAQATLYAQQDEPLNSDIELLCSLEGQSEGFGEPQILGSVNGLVVNRGYHVALASQAFKRALARSYSHDFHGFELYGLKFSIVTLAPEPMFSSQTKEKCSDIPGIGFECLGPLESMFSKAIRSNKDFFDVHVNRVLEYLLSIDNISKIDLVKGKLPIAAETKRASAMTSKKVLECTTTNREESELFIVEGQSAGGNLAQSRDVKKHAILMLKGKPLNSTSLSLESLLDNPELYDVVATIGLGVDDYHNTSEVRYGKVIILSDSDPDGSNINALVLGLFASHMKFLIEQGFVYLCKTPLYCQGTNYIYDDQLDLLDKSKPFIRFKGLGEMNPDQLKRFALSKDRRMIKVTLEGLDEAVSILTSTDARRHLLMKDGNINCTQLLKRRQLT